MDPIIAEALKLGIIALMEYARNKGLTDAEIEFQYHEARTQFLANDPAKIPDV